MPGTFRILRRGWIFCAAILIASAGAFAQQPDRLALARSRFDHETDPVHKAKLIVPLGNAEFDQIEKQINDNDATDALSGVQAYQQQAIACEKALDAKNVDAEKHPSGFKELQISVRESLRRLDNVLVRLAGDDQKPFLDSRKSLEDLDRRLIKQLFPSQPGVRDAPKPGS